MFAPLRSFAVLVALLSLSVTTGCFQSNSSPADATDELSAPDAAEDAPGDAAPSTPDTGLDATLDATQDVTVSDAPDAPEPLEADAPNDGADALADAGLVDATEEPAAPTITGPGPLSAVVGTAFSQGISASGPGPITYSLQTPLPDGLVIDPAAGAITGTPTPAGLLGGSPTGVYSVIVRATNAGGYADTAPFTVTVSGVPLPSPLVYFTYDTADVTDAGVLRDLSGNHHDGTISGGVTTGAAGAVGEAFVLDGTSGLVQATGVPTPTGPISLVATVKPSAIHIGLRDPVGYGLSAPTPYYRGQWLEMQDDGTALGVFEDNANELASSTIALPTNAFTALAMTWNDTSRIGRLFVAGQQAGTVTTAGPLLYATTNLETGRHPQFAARFWEGAIDEVGMWNVELTPEQMATIAWLSMTGKSMKTWIGL